MELVENKSDMRQEFWETLEILVSREWKRTEKDVMDDVHEWVEKVIARRDKSEDQDDQDSTAKEKAESSSSGYGSQDESRREEFMKRVKLPVVDCKFSHPHVRSRLEKLMGSNVVSLTDREYMQRLQQRIIEEYEQEVKKRIATREYQEIQRVKHLVLSGKIPLSEAPSIMDNHPVKLIEIYCQKIAAERRAKLMKPGFKIPKLSYPDDTPDPPSGLSIQKGHVFRGPEERLCHCPDPLIQATTEEETEKGHMFEDGEFTQLFYENPLILQLKDCQSVEEMYNLADQIIGILKEEEAAAAAPE